LRHIGIYGYRLATLRNFIALAPGALERRESLEQLRLLENGIRLQVALACEPVPGGVDTPADLERVRRHLERGSG
jgi:3-deoxy-manno-octulosonate cytidylyltransferase (CMP-KDO synthetase)